MLFKVKYNKWFNIKRNLHSLTVCLSLLEICISQMYYVTPFYE